MSRKETAAREREAHAQGNPDVAIDKQKKIQEERELAQQEAEKVRNCTFKSSCTRVVFYVQAIYSFCILFIHKEAGLQMETQVKQFRAGLPIKGAAKTMTGSKTFQSKTLSDRGSVLTSMFAGTRPLREGPGGGEPLRSSLHGGDGVHL